jgi:NADH-quinone oxidoreductase subunit C/D
LLISVPSTSWCKPRTHGHTRDLAARDKLLEVLAFLQKVPKPYVMLYDLHGVDERLRTHREGLPAADFTVFYHLLSIERNSDVMLKVPLNEADLNLPTATELYANANWYEREVWDLLGIKFDRTPPSHPHHDAQELARTPTSQGLPGSGDRIRSLHARCRQAGYGAGGLRFKPEEWGMRRSSESEDYMFLNLGPNHPSAHGAFRIVLQLDGEEIHDCVPDIGYHHEVPRRWASANPGTAISPTPIESSIWAG